MSGILNIMLASGGTQPILLGLGISNLDEFFYNSSSPDDYATTGTYGLSIGPDGDFWTVNKAATLRNYAPDRGGSPDPSDLRPYEVIDLTSNQAEYTESVAITTEGNDWSLDGTKIFMANAVSGNLEEYGASVPWDVTTLAGAPDETYATGYANLSGIYVSIEGSYIYFTGEDRTCSRVLLNTPWDLTTATDQVTTGNLVSSGSPATNNYHDVVVSHDGIKLILLDLTNNNLLQFDMTTPHNLPDLTAGTDASFTLSLNNGAYGFSNALCKSHDQTKIFVGDRGDGASANTIDRYDWDIVSPFQNWDVEWWGGVQTDNVVGTLGCHFYNNGSNVIWTNQSGRVYQDTCIEPYKLDNPTNGTLAIWLARANCRNCWFNADGSKIYLLEFNNSDLYEHTVTNGNFDLSGGAPGGIGYHFVGFNDSLSACMSLDGVYLMAFDFASRVTQMFSMSVPFDSSTLSPIAGNSRVSPRGQGWLAYDMVFNHDGTGACVLNLGPNQSVDIWSFATPYDLNTVSVVSTRNIADDITSGSPPGWASTQCMTWDPVGQQKITIIDASSNQAQNTTAHYTA